MIFNFGSINIDHVYSVPHLPEPGETLAATDYAIYLGGKGINQSIAVSRARGDITHVGAVGPDGEWALEQIAKAGLDTGSIARIAEPTGHAIIYVDTNAENSIVIFSGANTRLTSEQIENHLKNAKAEDWVLLQNETNAQAEIAEMAGSRGCKVAYSAAPFDPVAAVQVLPNTDLLVVNEGEANALAEHMGCEPHDIPVAELLITKGSAGSVYRAGGSILASAAFSVSPVDTTGAGDTFLGSFLATYATGGNPANAMTYAAAASAIQVTRHGAANAIPDRDEVLEFLRKHGA